MEHTIRRIFVNLPSLGWSELKKGDYINNEPAYSWINNNDIEKFSFIWVHYQGNAHKVHISQMQFMD